MPDALPKFDEPPVVEAVLGVQFKPVAGLMSAHLGAFWSNLRPDWPVVSEVRPLPEIFERFGEETVSPGGPEFEVAVGSVPTRLMMRTRKRDRLLQVQRTRLLYNWLSTSEGPGYPTYQDLRPSFDRAFEAFMSFVEENPDLGPVMPDQWEVVYVNHLPQGGVWQSQADLSLVFGPLLRHPEEAADLEYEGLSAHWQFEIPPRRGRLHVELSHGWRKDEGELRPLVALSLTARGPIGDNGLDLGSGLDLGHKAIVRAFASMTSEEAQQTWGRVR